MAFLEADPKILIQPARVEYRRNMIAGQQSRTVEAKRLEWPMDTTGSEAHHGATYAVDGWELKRYGPTLGREDVTGIWFEEYEKEGAWA